jgi:hypothetical protein
MDHPNADGSADAFDFVAQLRIGDQCENPTARVHGPTLGGSGDTAPCPQSHLWTKTDLCMNAHCAASVTARFSAMVRGECRGEKTPEKGRPPPGGEEAEVVVYQPRGVGLIHTRP